MLYRPEGWGNRNRYGVTVNNVDLDGIYEAGADAMLEGLRKHPVNSSYVDERAGVFVFIPEEE